MDELKKSSGTSGRDREQNIFALENIFPEVFKKKPM
jgi:hypothetical protein